MKRALAAAWLTLAIVGLALWAQPTPAGACSLVDPCWDVEQSAALVEGTTETNGDSPAGVPEEATLYFDGLGQATGLELGNTYFTLVH